MLSEEACLRCSLSANDACFNRFPCNFVLGVADPDSAMPERTLNYYGTNDFRLTFFSFVRRKILERISMRKQSQGLFVDYDG
jgi:hypothetical protein